ncbi:MAG: hypothetical protein SCK57_11560 [Bacillota bacterium]|nr:hypothetical protein [Bacillota bacterium]MDW7678287.1 hypothetical protein [Bacillota bacterium]
MKTGEKYHHWRYGPLKVVDLQEGYVEMEILDFEGIVRVPGDPWNKYLEIKETKWFRLEDIGQWLHKNAKELKKKPTPLEVESDRHQVRIHQHYR